MDDEVSEQFIKLGKETIDRAQRIDCSPRDYVEGLRIIIGDLEDEIAAAEQMMG